MVDEYVLPTVRYPSVDIWVEFPVVSISHNSNPKRAILSVPARMLVVFWQYISVHYHSPVISQNTPSNL